MQDSDKAVRMDEDLHHRVRIEAAKQKTTIKDYVAEAVREKLERDQEQPETD